MLSIDEIIEEVNTNLEDITRSVVSKEVGKETNSLIQQYKQQFFIELDSPEQHQPNWHQWGIITHTKNFMKMYDNEVKQYLKAWNRLEAIEEHLSGQIDGISKSKLIYLGILLHDIGKFRKNYSKKLNGRVIYTFNKHEVYSQEIIQNDLYPLLHYHYGLTDKQIEYIAMCARYHFELGFIREIGKKSKYGYSAACAKSQEFKDAVMNALPAFEKYKIEVGVLFLADSYAKTDIAFEERTDNEILEDLKHKNLNLKLMYAVKQKSVNLETVKSYFDVIMKGKKIK